MTIVLTGLSHKTAPVELRERLAFAKDGGAERLCALVDGEVVREGLVVSTCNRVEVLACVNESKLREGESRLLDFVSGGRASSDEELSKHLYTLKDSEAVRHLFRVASSLDSMVVGEPQILGQVRDAYTRAVEAGTAGRVTHRLMHHAFHAAKRVRSETAVASSAVSVPYAAVELGRKILGSLEGRTVLLVGAGEMAYTAARHLANAGASRVLVANRTYETARRLAAEFGGCAVEFGRLREALAEADIVICSTAALGFVVTPDMARAAREARRNAPAFFIDISVPRNVDPEVAKLGNLFVFDVDDLESVVASNLRERGREAARAELIVEAEARQFEETLRALDAGPRIGEFRRELQEIARAEFARGRRRLGSLTPEQERAVEALLVSTANKIAHPAIRAMRSSPEAEVEKEFGAPQTRTSEGVKGATSLDSALPAAA